MTNPHATVLARWRLGLGLARACALTAVRACLAPGLGRQAPTVRPQWRACGDDAAATRGTARGARRVERGVVPLLAGVVSLWQGPPVALALEATTVGPRLTVVVVRGVSRGGASPVAWVVRSATATQAWRREWVRRRRRVPRAVPRAWTVIVLAERGLDARWRFRRLTRLGGPPCWRSPTGGTCRPAGRVHGVPLQTLGPQPGPSWPGTGRACNGRQRPLPGPLVARWEAGDQAPWVLLTARPPAARTAWWAGVRAWMAHGVTRTTRAGGPWQRPHRTQPDRAARRWLAVAGATWWLLSLGGEAKETSPASPVLAVPALICQPPRPRRAPRLRLVRVGRRGGNLILGAWLDQAPLPLGRLVPDPWPALPGRAEATPALPVLALPQAA